MVPLLLSTLLQRAGLYFTSLYYTVDKTLLLKTAQPALFVFGGGIFVSVVIYCIFGEKYDGCHVEASSSMSMNWIWRSKFNTWTYCFKIRIAAIPIPSEETTGVCSSISMCYCVVLTNPAPYLVHSGRWSWHTLWVHCSPITHVAYYIQLDSDVCFSRKCKDYNVMR